MWLGGAPACCCRCGCWLLLNAPPPPHAPAPSRAIPSDALPFWSLPARVIQYKSNPWGDLSTGHMDMMWTQGLKGFGGLVSSLDMLAKAETGAHADMDIVQHDTVGG